VAAGVTISGFKFSPATLTVSAGQQVNVMNSDGVTHTFTSSAWDSGDIQPGASYTLTAPTQAGSYQFHCSIHPFMTGTLVVE
jgi:plastocyanin